MLCKNIKKKRHIQEKSPFWRERRLAGLSQEKAAERLGISTRTLQKYERGKAQPRFDMVVRMAEIYGCDLYAFLCSRRCGATSFLRNSDKIYEKKRNASQAPGRRFWPSAAARTRTRSWRPLWTRWWPPGSLIVRSVGWRWTTRPTPCDCYCSKWGGM